MKIGPFEVSHMSHIAKTFKQHRSQGPLLLGRGRVGEDPGNEVDLKATLVDNFSGSSMKSNSFEKAFYKIFSN